VNYRTYGDLERCLASVKTQTLAPTRVLVVDNDPVASELRELERRHPEVGWQPRRNRGFSEAANFILDRFRDGDHCEEFFLLLNPDVRLEPEFAERLLAEMQRFEQAALGSGKLLRPDTGGIDSAGIVLPRHRRPRDRGSEEPDRGQYERTEFVFGASGAALMVRASALDDLSIEGEVFDEDFFTYHEDTDLAWRANRLGWRVLYVPGARALHERHWRRDRRFVIPDRVRRHSFKNHYLQLIKNESAGGFLVNLPAIACWEILRLGYALLRLAQAPRVAAAHPRQGARERGPRAARPPAQSPRATALITRRAAARKSVEGSQPSSRSRRRAAAATRSSRG
jgi:GT2 family glycosyltransferase